MVSKRIELNNIYMTAIVGRRGGNTKGAGKRGKKKGVQWREAVKKDKIIY